MKDWLSIPEITQRLELSDSTVRRYLDTQGYSTFVPNQKRSGVRRYHPTVLEVLRYVERRRNTKPATDWPVIYAELSSKYDMHIDAEDAKKTPLDKHAAPALVQDFAGIVQGLVRQAVREELATLHTPGDQDRLAALEEENARLRQENARLRGEAPLEDADLGQVDDDQAPTIEPTESPQSAEAQEDEPEAGEPVEDAADAHQGAEASTSGESMGHEAHDQAEDESAGDPGQVDPEQETSAAEVPADDNQTPQAEATEAPHSDESAVSDPKATKEQQDAAKAPQEPGARTLGKDTLEAFVQELRELMDAGEADHAMLLQGMQGRGWMYASFRGRGRVELTTQTIRGVIKQCLLEAENPGA